MASIFISYRRQDSGGHAGRLRDHLRQHFGELVFQDVDDIPAGAEFDRILSDALASAKVGIVVIGPQWLSCTDARGQRRLDIPADWVRTEVRQMLERGITVIPVLVGGVRSLEGEALPEDIRPLASRQTRVLSDEAWSAGVEALVARIESLVGRRRGGRRWLGWSVGAAVALAIGIGVALQSGNHSGSAAPSAAGASAADTAAPPTIATAADRLGALGRWVMDDFSGMEVKDPSRNFELKLDGGELRMVPLDGADRTPWRVVRLVERAFIFEALPVNGREPDFQYSFQLSPDGKRFAECQTLDRKSLQSMGACTWKWVRGGEALSTDPVCGKPQREVDPACVAVAKSLALTGDWQDLKGRRWQVLERGGRVLLQAQGADASQALVLLQVEGRDVVFAPQFGNREPPDLDAQASVVFERGPDGRGLLRCRERMLLSTRTDETACGPDLPAALRRPS